jgi:hypothetical protein
MAVHLEYQKVDPMVDYLVYSKVDYLEFQKVLN